MRLLACGGGGRTSELGEPPSPLMKGEHWVRISERRTSRFGVSAPLTLSDNFVKLQFLAVHSQRASSAFGGGAIQRSNRNVLAQVAEEWPGGRLRRSNIGFGGERSV